MLKRTREPLTWDSFLLRARNHHGHQFDYSDVYSCDFEQGMHHKINITCIVCGYKFSPTINSHINTGKGCKKCAGLLKMTKDEVIRRAQLMVPKNMITRKSPMK